MTAHFVAIGADVSSGGAMVGFERCKSASDQLDGLPPMLVAEDHASAVVLILRFLRAMRLVNPVVVVRRGDEALRFLDETDRRPAVALLDLQMPGASGLDVLRWMRGRHEYEDLPVLVLTGSADLDVINETHDLGAVHYLVKPVGFEALGDVLRRIDLPWALLAPPSSGATE